MPKVENQIATLLTFKPVEAGAGRVSLIPGQPVELDADVLDRMWRKDRVFKAYYKDRAIEIDGWKPSGDVERSDDIPASMKNPHGAAPTSEMMPPSSQPEPEEASEVKPIEPTPVSGVPGNSKQARASVYASVDADQLNAWLSSESRKTVKSAINDRLKELAKMSPEDIAAAGPKPDDYAGADS